MLDVTHATDEENRKKGINADIPPGAEQTVVLPQLPRRSRKLKAEQGRSKNMACRACKTFQAACAAAPLLFKLSK